MNKTLLFRITLLLATALLLLSLSGCGENSTEPPQSPTIEKDAAETITASLAYNTGGTIDQLIDLSTLATADGFNGMKDRYPGTYFIIQRDYDPVQGKWSIHIERERGTVGHIPYAFVSRDYLLQYLNADGVPQQYYITASDTARTVNFQVLSGQGRHQTRRLSQQLNQLSANWVLTDAHQDVMTVNGSYYRAAVDTIRTFTRVRTSDHNLQLNITDLTLPRGSSPSLVNAISGTVTGHFHADITFTNGSSYSENVIDRDINIVIGGGQANIGLGPETYLGNIVTGELLE